LADLDLAGYDHDEPWCDIPCSNDALAGRKRHSLAETAHLGNIIRGRVENI
jgi:hypothetical protein